MMLTRIAVLIVLGCAAILQGGCGNSADHKERPVDTPVSLPPAGVQSVTLHVDGMASRLGLFGPTGPNKVQKALVELHGVESVKVDLENDRLLVRYAPAKITPQGLVEAVGTQGFTATIVSGDAKKEE